MGKVLSPVWHFALGSAVLLLLGSSFAIGQEPNFTALSGKLKSDQWTERAAAVGEILGMPGALQSTEVRGALIELLDRENRIIDDSYRRRIGVSNEYGEGYGGYYSTLLGALTNVADFKDKRFLEILAQGSYNPDSQFAQKLADAGELIVPIALELLKSDIGPKHWNAVGILGMVYEKRQVHHLSERAAQNIKQTMIAISTGDKESVTRTLAVNVLGKIATTADIPVLESIAKSDSARYKRGEKLRYPVREAAGEAITAIRSRNRER